MGFNHMLVITEVDNREKISQMIPRRYWRVRYAWDVPYRDRQSIQAFWNYKKDRNTNPDGVLYYKRVLQEYNFDRKSHQNHWIGNRDKYQSDAEYQYWLNYYPAEEDIPLLDIWEFYKIVGFDPKAKKWINTIT